MNKKQTFKKIVIPNLTYSTIRANNPEKENEPKKETVEGIQWINLAEHPIQDVAEHFKNHQKFERLKRISNLMQNALDSRDRYENFVRTLGFHLEEVPDYQNVDTINIENEKVVIREFPENDTES